MPGREEDRQPMDFNDRIARASLHVEVADRVREMIFDRTLAPGLRIDELDLSARLGTSRTPLREALKVLANEGLVRLAPGRGAYVTELSPQEVESLFPVLAMLEARCAGEAVRRLGPIDRRRLEAMHQAMEQQAAAGNADGYHRVADELHALLHEASGNPWLQRATTDLRRFLRLARSMSGQAASRLLQSLAEHRTLMRAIARNDAEAAEQVMQHHLLAQQKAWRAAHAALQATAGKAEDNRQAQTRAGAEVSADQPVDGAAEADAGLAGTTAPSRASAAAEPATPPLRQPLRDVESVDTHSRRETEFIGV